MSDVDQYIAEAQAHLAEAERNAAELRLIDEHPDLALQLLADGYALHRLREALPDASHVEVKSWVSEWLVSVVRVVDGEPHQSFRGDTIAEAADACREALG